MRRNLLTGAGLIAAAVLLAVQCRNLLADPTIWPPDDFVEYWSAARLTLDGQNPYDPDLLLPLQRAAGRDTPEAVMMWNPPWSLAVVLPLGLLPARVAQLLWLALNFAAIGFCGDRLWLLFRGPPERRWLGCVVALVFLPSLFALQSGQISPLLLLGAVLFMTFIRRGWHFAAGAATLLLAVKPHLAYLIWLAILVDALARRREGIILGAVSAGLAATLIALACNGGILAQYADAITNRPPAQWVSLTMGSVLRLIFGPEHFRLQFVPVVFGVLWFAWHWRRNSQHWDWIEQTPLLLLVSFVTAPYGAWPFDMVLLLPAVIQLVSLAVAPTWGSACPARVPVLFALIGIDLACLVINLLHLVSFAFVWVPPTVLILYIAGIRALSAACDGAAFSPAGAGMKAARFIGPGAIAFLAIWVLLLLAGRSSFFRDPGTFWHTSTGELILSEGWIRANPYTFTFAGNWWVPYQWLGEVAMALAHRAGGFDTQFLGAVTILAATFAWLSTRLLRTGLHPIAVCVVIALALAAAGSHFHVRPHLFTIACMALTAGWLTDVDEGRSRLAKLLWLWPIFIIWTNVHGGVLGGMASLGLVFAGWVLFWLIGRRTPIQSWRNVGMLAAVGLGCGLSALINPYGFDMIRTWQVIMDEPILKDIIMEHRPLDIAKPYAWSVLALAGVYLFVLVGIDWRDLRVSWLLPIFWLFEGFSRCRHVALFAVVAVVAIAAIWPHTRWAAWMGKHRPDLYQPREDQPRTPLWANLWLPVLMVATAFALQLARVPVPLIGSGWVVHDPDHWPVELLDVLKENEPHSPTGNHLFNGYIDGGFVIYHAPGYKVFVDDRCELFGGDWLQKFVEAEGSPDDPDRTKKAAAAIAEWEEKYGRFDFALVRPESGFEAVFSQSDQWKTIKRTDTATFYRRKESP